jgi:PAS domain S-box-containing protein
LSATGNALAVGRVWKLSENRIATILTSAPSGIITIGEDGRIRTANPAAEDMFGFTIGEMRGENVKMLMPEPFHNEHDRYLQQYLASGEKHVIGIGRQVVGRRKDGSTFPVDLEVGEMDMEGERQFTAILHDSSTRQRTERQLLEAKQQAEAASKAKSQFLANMSHELRAPLNAIIGYSQLLQFENKRGQKDRITKEINRAGEHLLALINRVLDLARIESGKIEVSVESVSLSEIFKDCFSVIWPMAEKAAVEIKMDCAELYVQCDRLRIKQVLINLLTNAVKYNRPNGEISLRCERSEAGRVRIQVTNSGVGLTEEGIRHIFEPFERLGADATRVEGTGIGLTISKQLVELMDGTLGVESTLDVTTTFSVDLPEGSRPPGDGMVQETSFGEDLATPRSGRVLVLEDNPMNQRVLREQLETLGQYVSMAANGEEGLRQWRTGAFDLVLSDIRMPVMDGYEFIRALRALEVEQHLGRTKVVGVSGLAMAEERTRCLSAGMDDCMTKPIDFKKLKRDLIAWLGEPALVAAVPA